MIDHQGRIIEFNPAAEQVFGFTKDEVVGRPMTELIKPPPWSERHRRSLDALCRHRRDPAPRPHERDDGPPRRRHRVSRRADPQPRRMWMGRRLFNVCIRDITERKAGEEARQRLAAIVESSDDAIIGITIEGDITSWNRGAREIFGYTAEEVVGRPIVLLEPPGMSTRSVANCRGFDGASASSITRRSAGARTAPRSSSSLTLSPIRDARGQVIGASQIARDVTAKKLADREVKRLNHELQERVGELQTLLDVLPIGVWISDATAESIIGNRAAYEMLGIQAGTNVSPTSPEARMGRSPGFKCLRDGQEIPPINWRYRPSPRTGIGQRNYEQDLVFDDGRALTIQGIRGAALR